MQIQWLSSVDTLSLGGHSVLCSVKLHDMKRISNLISIYYKITVCVRGCLTVNLLPPVIESEGSLTFSSCTVNVYWVFSIETKNVFRWSTLCSFDTHDLDEERITSVHILFLATGFWSFLPPGPAVETAHPHFTSSCCNYVFCFSPSTSADRHLWCF